eukprot:Pgem_evm1s3449
MNATLIQTQSCFSTTPTQKHKFYNNTYQKQQLIKYIKQQQVFNLKRQHSEIEEQENFIINKRAKREQATPITTPKKSQTEYSYNKFTIGKCIHKGGMASVYQGNNKETGELVALKVFQKKNKNIQLLKKIILREVMIQNSLSQTCENISKVKGVIENEEEIAIITPYYHNARTTQQHLSEEVISSFSLQIANGIKHMHDHNVVHRDIKLENIVVDNDGKTCQIIDFDTATILNTTASSIAGTQHYLAPELFIKKQEMENDKNMVYKIDQSTKATDVWSLGIVFY